MKDCFLKIVFNRVRFLKWYIRNLEEIFKLLDKWGKKLGWMRPFKSSRLIAGHILDRQMAFSVLSQINGCRYLHRSESHGSFLQTMWIFSFPVDSEFDWSRVFGIQALVSPNFCSDSICSQRKAPHNLTVLSTVNY